MKKVPLRMCLSCGQMIPKKQLFRVVKTSDNKIIVDVTGKIAGRGAYICSSIKCVENLKKQRLLNKAFKMAVKDEVYEEITEVINNNVAKD